MTCTVRFILFLTQHFSLIFTGTCSLCILKKKVVSVNALPQNNYGVDLLSKVMADVTLRLLLLAIFPSKDSFFFVFFL